CGRARFPAGGAFGSEANCREHAGEAQRLMGFTNSDGMPRMMPMALRPVLMLVGGGLEHGGGIGRLVGYIAKAWNQEIHPRITVVDTRGPDLMLFWPFFFVKSILQIIGYSPQHPLIHIHLAANLSTLRKLILANLARLFRLDFVIHLHDPTFPDFFKSLPRW